MDVISGHLKTHQIFGVPLMILLQDHMPAWEAQIKRLIDIVASALVLVGGAPAWLLLAGIIKWTSPGKAIYNQSALDRTGKHSSCINSVPCMRTPKSTPGRNGRRKKTRV